MIDFILDHEGWFIGAAIVILLIVAVIAMYETDRQWQEYASAHHCQVKGTKQGQPAVGWSYGEKGGPVVTVQPDQTIYVCDGGEIVIR